MRNDRISSFFFLKKKGERWFLIWVWVIFLETFVSFYWNAESWTVFGSKENQFRTEHPPYGITLICSFGKCPFGKQQSGTNRINLFHHPLYSFFFFSEWPTLQRSETVFYQICFYSAFPITRKALLEKRNIRFLAFTIQ